MSQWKTYVLYRSFEHFRFGNDLYKQYVCGRGMNRVVKASAAFATELCIEPELKCFYPTELCHDIEARAPFMLCIPPLPYLLFLLFLCHHKLGNIDSSLTALHDLQVLVKDEEQGCLRYPIVMNLLATCRYKLGDVLAAIDMCLHSQRLKPEKNGADALLDKILRENF